MKNKAGSYWLKTDLQVHTPVARWEDFQLSSPPTSHEKIQWAEKLVQTTIDKEIELIALTEHNDGSYIDETRRVAKRSGQVEILPGVEICSSEGIHILAIFDPEKDLQKEGSRNWDDFIQHFLSTLGVPKKRFQSGSPERAGKQAIDILESVDREGGICIFPHALNHDGSMERIRRDQLLGYSNADTKKGIYKHPLCRIVQIPKTIAELHIGDQEILQGKNPDYGKAVACITASDTRSFSDLGEKQCWIKADPTFEGLKQIMYEPTERVYIGEQPPLYLHPQISSISNENTDSSQTFCLENSNIVPLSPNLNVIIGGRGTGKTTLLESIGFIFDQHVGGSTYALNTSQRIPLISRTIEELVSSSTVAGIKIKTIYGQSESTAERKLEYQSLIPSVGFGIEYWPQGEIEEHAYNADKLRKLLQPLLQNSDFSALEEELATLLANASQISDEYENIPTLKQKLTKAKEKLTLHKRVLSTVQDSSFQQLITEMKELNKEKRKLDHAMSSAARSADQLESTLGEIEEIEFEEIRWDTILAACSIEEGVLTPQTLAIDINEKIQKLRQLAEKIRTSDHYTKTSRKLEKAQESYSQVAIQLGLKLTTDQIAESSRQSVLLEQEIARIEKQVSDIEESSEKHDSYIQQVSEVREKLETIRKDTFQSISQDLGEGVLIEDGETFDESTVVEIFSDLADKQNLRIKEMIATVLPEIHLSGIIQHLRDEAIPECISGQFGKTAEWFFTSKDFINRKLLSMKLEEVQPVFSPVVTQDGKNLEDLSFGERCALVLRIVLCYGDAPVIIDQPEDHLDNEFITENLLDILRERKSGRQIILATHNPNIVVNADAENVVILRKPTSGQTKCASLNGGLEDKQVRTLIAKILEGGEVAFKKREIRYEF